MTSHALPLAHQPAPPDSPDCAAQPACSLCRNNVVLDVTESPDGLSIGLHLPKLYLVNVTVIKKNVRGHIIRCSRFG